MPNSIEPLQLNLLIQSLTNILKHDTSNMCKKYVLSALCICFPNIINSNYAIIALKILFDLLELKQSTYNLVKLELIQLLSLINFRALYFAEQKLYLTSNNDLINICTIDIQNRILKDIFLSLLGSDDIKLRLETARRITNLIQNLYCDTSELNILSSEANYLKHNLNLLASSEISSSNFQFLHSTLKLNLCSSNYVQPFKNLMQYPDTVPNSTLESNLNCIIQLLIETLINTTEKCRFLGCIECFNFIFQVYEPSIYLNSNCLVDLLNLLVSYLQHPFVTFDLYIHEIILRVIGSLYCAAVWKFIVKLDPNLVNLEFLNTSQPWYLLLNNNFLINIADTLFTHIMHFLCLISSVIDENVLISNSPSPANLITSTLSGVVSNSKSIQSTTSVSGLNSKFKQNFDNLDKTQSSQAQQSQNETTSKSNNSFMGLFQNSSTYLKLYDSVKLAYNSYKKSPYIGINDKFFKCIRAILKLLSQLLECALSTNETSKYLDEILIYLKVVFTVDSANVIKCVTQMLKSLFRLNFLNNYLNSLSECVSSNSISNLKTDSMTTFVTMLHYKFPGASGRKSGLFASLVKNISADFNAYLQNQNALFKNDQRLGSPTNFMQTSQDNFHYENEMKLQSQQSPQYDQASVNQTVSRFSLNPLNIVNLIRKKPNESLKQIQQQRLKLDSKLISQYIHSFESIVIKSLRQYTTTSYVNLQVRVLELLIQLINLKVNYSLLDSDKIFIEHILKQFDYLEQKHCCEETLANINDQSVDIDPIENDLSLNAFSDSDINLNKLYFNCCFQYQQQLSSSSSISFQICLIHKYNQHKNFYILIPKVFEFLILLSYEKIDSKHLITIPNIIQLCDNLLASENSPHTHVIPALRPLVYELFINTKLKIENNKELELQRDVLVIALQRLIYYPQIWHLLSIVIFKYKKENNEEKWKKMSRQVCDILFQNIKFEQLKFDEYNMNDLFADKKSSRNYNPYLLSLKYLLTLFNSLSPQVYRPIDFILKSFIDLINIQYLKVNSRNNWLASCIAHLYLLINYSNEELILTRLHDLLLSKSSLISYIKPRINLGDELNIDNELMNSASCIITFLLKVIYLTLNYIKDDIQFNSIDYLKRINTTLNYQDTFKSMHCTLNLLYNYILYLIYILKSGYFKKISDTLGFFITKIFTNENEINDEENIISYLFNINKIIFNKISINFPLLALLWQYFLLICNKHESIYWSLTDEKNESSSVISPNSSNLSLNDRLFKQVSLLVYCEYTINNNLLDNTKNLTNLIVNNLIDLLNLNNEACVLDVISMVHRNSSASSLFIHSINSNWNEIIGIKRLYLLQACLKLVEGIHLSVSGHLLEFLVEKYFKLPYLSLVRYADFIACQRLEMIQLLSIDEIKQQLDEEHFNKILKYFQGFKYSHRHQRFISLLKNLNQILNSDCCQNLFSDKLKNDTLLLENMADKNLYLEGVKNICCSENNNRISLKPKQCALILAELEYNNLLTILTTKSFKLTILKECFLLGANINKANSKNDSLWLATKNGLFELLSNICSSLPNLPHVQVKIITDSIYYSKLNELLNSFDLYSFILPLIEAINAFLQSRNFIHENDSQSNDIITFSLFGLNLVSYISTIKHKILTIHFIQEVFISIYNILNNNCLRNTLIQRNNYSTLLSHVIISLYDILVAYFFKAGDQNSIYAAKSNIQYKAYSIEIVFSSFVFDILLKLRFVITNHVSTYLKLGDKGDSLRDSSTSNLFVHRSPNRFIQYDSKFFRTKIPFNIRDLIDKIFLGICQVPIIDRFLRISDALWCYNIKIDYSQLMNADSTLPSIEYLKDPHFLKEHIKHCLRVGWSSRAQFEYEYVHMLTLLHSLCTDVGNNESVKLAVEEIKERNRCACLVFKALSSWLIKSTLSPHSGCSLNSKYEFLSRNKAPLFIESTIGENFVEMKQKLENFSINRSFSIKSSPLINSDEHHYLNKIIDSSFNILSEQKNDNSGLSNTKKKDYLFSRNLERPMMNDLSPLTDSYYYFSQISLEGLIKFSNDQSVRDVDISYNFNKDTNTDDLNKNFQTVRSFVNNKLDLASVLRTILDHYESFWKNQTLQVKSDILKSMIYISNSLFDSCQQYELLLVKLEEEFDLNDFFNSDSIIQANISPSTDLIDDSTMSIVLYGQAVCKCCLQTVKEMKNKDFENINKLIDNALKSNSSVIKIASIHGLFWLQSLSLDYLNSSIDTKILTEHLCKQIYLMKDFTVYTTSNPRYVATLWSAIFFTIENSVDSIKDAQNFVSTFVKITLDILSDSTTPYFLFYQLYLGIERLLLSHTIPSSEMKAIQKLLNFKFHDDQRVLCLNLLQVASLYSTNQLKNINYLNEIKLNISNQNNYTSQSQFHSEMLSSYPQILELNSKPELQTALLKVLEVATTIFDKMKVCTFIEESIACAHLLPYILCDFIPPHDLLNKLITEFSNSSQLPLPEAMAFILNKCFDILIQRGLISQIQDWCLLSLSNFILRPNTLESIWFMSCLLISVSKNKWLKAMFPFILNRNCIFEDIDKKIFFKAFLEFKSELNSDVKINSIIKIFEQVSGEKIIYQELLKFIQLNDSI